jgi:diadenosine tetraphosphate (Ap4A) HIT family hydrolase
VRELVDLDHRPARPVEEIALAERVLSGLHRPDKLNVAALGNMVPQLHVHVIARPPTIRPAAPWGAVPRTIPTAGRGRGRPAAAAFADPALADG